MSGAGNAPTSVGGIVRDSAAVLQGQDADGSGGLAVDAAALRGLIAGDVAGIQREPAPEVDAAALTRGCLVAADGAVPQGHRVVQQGGVDAGAERDIPTGDAQPLERYGSFCVDGHHSAAACAEEDGIARAVAISCPAQGHFAVDDDVLVIATRTDPNDGGTGRIRDGRLYAVVLTAVVADITPAGAALTDPLHAATDRTRRAVGATRRLGVPG